MRKPKSASRFSTATLLVVALALSAFVMFTVQFQRKSLGDRESCRSATLWKPWMFCYIFELDVLTYQNLSKQCWPYVQSTFEIAQLNFHKTVELLSKQFPWFQDMTSVSDMKSPAMNVLTRLGFLYLEGGVLVRSDINCSSVANAYHRNKIYPVIIGGEGSFVIAPPESPFFSAMMLPFLDRESARVLGGHTANDIIRNVIITAYERYACKGHVLVVDERSGNATNQHYMHAKFQYFSFKKLFGSSLHAIITLLLFLANVFVFVFVIRVILSERSEESDPENPRIDEEFNDHNLPGV